MRTDNRIYERSPASTSGIFTSTRVPLPGSLSIETVPPNTKARSLIPRMPRPSRLFNCSRGIPFPLSRTSKIKQSSSPRKSIHTRVAAGVPADVEQDLLENAENRRRPLGTEVRSELRGSVLVDLAAEPRRAGRKSCENDSIAPTSPRSSRIFGLSCVATFARCSIVGVDLPVHLLDFVFELRPLRRLIAPGEPSLEEREVELQTDERLSELVVDLPGDVRALLFADGLEPDREGPELFAGFLEFRLGESCAP